MAAFNGQALPYVPTNAPVGQQIAAINRIIDRLNDMLQQIVLSDNTSRRMFIGYQKDGWGTGKDFGIKISQPGIDVLVAEPEQLLFSLSVTDWTWRNSDGNIVKQFINATGTDHYYDPSGRNYVNIGLRLTPATYGFEMAKPGIDLNNGPA